MILRAIARVLAWSIVVGAITGLGIGRPAVQSAVTAPAVVFWLVVHSPTAVIVVSASVASAAFAFGPRDVVEAILRALSGSYDTAPERLVRLGDALALTGRTLLAVALACALLQQASFLLWIDASLDGQFIPRPSRLAAGISSVLGAPLVAVLLGRCVLLSQARALHVAGGAPRQRSVGPWTDLAALLFIVPALLILPLVFFRVS